MNNEFDITGQSEFDNKTTEEMLEEFMNSCPVSDDVYVNFYGASFLAMMKVLPTSVRVFMWMTYNCELNKNRVTIQSLTQKRLLKECGISQITYFNCLRDLKKHNVIRGCRAIYYINPKFAWRGTHQNRMKFIEQYPFIQNKRLPKNEFQTTDF